MSDWRSQPTAEEFEAHHATHARGNKSWWVTIYPDEVETGRDPYVWVSFGEVVHGVLPSPNARWSPRDARLMPVTWPVVTKVVA